MIKWSHETFPNIHPHQTKIRRIFTPLFHALQAPFHPPKASFYASSEPLLCAKKVQKTYNSGDSPVVTHLTTSPPVRCLNRAERTGSLVFNVLWSYVEEMGTKGVYI
jgi:hypothetical protein